MSTDVGMYFWRKGDELFLFVSGRITATEAYSMYHHVAEWIERNPCRSIFVDLDRTEYMDSTTIGTLIRLHKQQRSVGGEFFLCNLSPAVAEVIEKTKLSRYFSIIENEVLHDLEDEFLEKLPDHEGGDVDSSFVLDAHNDICKVRPELTPQFEVLLGVLRRQVSEERGQSHKPI